MQRVSRLQVKMKKWPDAAKSCEESIKLMQEAGATGTVGRTICALVMIELIREDVVAAKKAYAVSSRNIRITHLLFLQ